MTELTPYNKFILYVSKLPKTSLSMILWAINTYLLSKWIIDNETAMFVSTIFVWLWITVNVATNNWKVQSLEGKSKTDGWA